MEIIILAFLANSPRLKAVNSKTGFYRQFARRSITHVAKQVLISPQLFRPEQGSGALGFRVRIAPRPDALYDSQGIRPPPGERLLDPPGIHRRVYHRRGRYRQCGAELHRQRLLSAALERTTTGPLRCWPGGPPSRGSVESGPADHQPATPVADLRRRRQDPPRWYSGLSPTSVGYFLPTPGPEEFPFDTQSFTVHFVATDFEAEELDFVQTPRFNLESPPNSPLQTGG